MKPSPFRFLVSRHLCTCRPQGAASRASPFFRIPRRNASYSAPAASYGTAESLKRRYQAERPADDDDPKAARAQTLKRMRWSVAGIALCAVAMYGTLQAYDLPVGAEGSKKSVGGSGNVTHNDGPAPPPSPDSILEHAELVPTGTTSVPFFPRTIQLSSPEATATSQTVPNPSIPAGTIVDQETSSTEYQLLGLGIRTVSFLGIQVYVVGLYVATPDIAKLQERLIRTIDPVATTLVPNEKEKLRGALTDPVQGEEIWNTLLKEGGIRTAFRIVPTRNTDFMHMRDAFVRGVTARAGSPLATNDPAFDPQGNFGGGVNDLKAVFSGSSRKKLPFGQTLLLERAAGGELRVVFEDKAGVREVMGTVGDERVARLLWLNYLAGKNVSSEDARKSVVEGCVEWSGRPVGTVATQVV